MQATRVLRVIELWLRTGLSEYMDTAVGWTMTKSRGINAM